MNKFCITCYLAFFAFTVFAQEEAYTHIDNFTKIDVTDKIIVQLERSTTSEIQVNVQEMEKDNVVVEVVDGVLKLSVDNELKPGKVRINIKYKELTEISGSGMAEISTGNLIKSNTLNVKLLSGANAYLDLDIQTLNAEIAERSLFQADGYAVNQEITLKTYGIYSGYECEGEKVHVSAGMGTKAKVYAEEELNVDARSGAYVSYKGEPKTTHFEAKSGSSVEAATP